MDEEEGGGSGEGLCKAKGLPSPDLADALAMAFMRPPSLQIWTGYEAFLRAPRPPAGVPLPSANGAAHDDDGADGVAHNGDGAGGSGAAYDDNGHAPSGAGIADVDGAQAPESSSPYRDLCITPCYRAAASQFTPSIKGNCGLKLSYAKVSYKGRGRREAAGEGTGDAPPSDPPAPQDPADIPLDRFFIRF